jgi:hypothetical protein
LDGGKDISVLQKIFEIQAISSEPSVDNCSASGCGPRTFDENNGILASRDAQGGGRSSNRDLTSDDSGDEVLSSSPT